MVMVMGQANETCFRVVSAGVSVDSGCDDEHGGHQSEELHLDRGSSPILKILTFKEIRWYSTTPAAQRDLKKKLPEVARFFPQILFQYRNIKC